MKAKTSMKSKASEGSQSWGEIPVVFCCKRCKVPVSKPLAQVKWLAEYEYGTPEFYENPRVPSGSYFIEAGNYVLNLGDLMNTIALSDNGCCGRSGVDGRNTTCIKKHEIGTEHSDCWQQRDIVLESDNVSPVPQYKE